jgi:hypothetical protein
MGPADWHTFSPVTSARLQAVTFGALRGRFEGQTHLTHGAILYLSGCSMSQQIAALKRSQDPATICAHRSQLGSDSLRLPSKLHPSNVERRSFMSCFASIQNKQSTINGSRTAEKHRSSSPTSGPMGCRFHQSAWPLQYHYGKPMNHHHSREPISHHLLKQSTAPRSYSSPHLVQILPAYTAIQYSIQTNEPSLETKINSKSVITSPSLRTDQEQGLGSLPFV